MPFHANFYDGKLSRTHKATISVNSLHWKITYDDESGNPVSISWRVADIKKSDVYTKNWVSFTYGETFPFQKIESDDKRFIEYINNSGQGNLSSKVDVLLHRSVKKSLVILLLSLLIISIGTYFFVIPAVAKGFVANMDEKNVIGFGNYVFRVLSNELEINEEASEKLQDFVDEMDMETSFPLEMYVAENDELNAFALSGGKIVIFSPLLDLIESEDQLVALIGHEVSHIENRHVLKNVARNLSGAIFMSILFGDVNSVTTIMADNAHLFSQLSYTRSLEKEADIFGLEIMRNNNVDLHGMPQLFQILKDEVPFDSPTYLSNHPMLKDRIDYTKEIADEQEEVPKNKELQEKWEVLKSSLKKLEDDGEEIIEETTYE